MMLSFLRRALPAGGVSALAVVAIGVSSGTASANLARCAGENITGQGSSLQKLGQENVWIPAFKEATNTNEFACTKGSPTITYTSTGSGTGMRKWGVEATKGETIEFGAGNAFIGTDEPPSEAQKKEITLQAKGSKTALLTIPVLQGAAAVVAHLPANCVASSTSNPGRIVLNNKTLEEVFRGVITKWSQITENGDSFTKSGGTCNPSTEIQRVVRLDQSGTTHIFKRYLNLINSTAFTVAGGSHSWGEISEGKLNTEWPGSVLRPSSNGGGALVEKVNTTASSIGYANLADARANAGFVPPEGGASKAKFWIPLQRTAGEVYADPSSGGEVSSKAEKANCESTEFTNGSKTFPPKSVEEPFNEVTTKVTEPHYTICGLTYDLALRNYSSYPGTNEKEATSAENYLRFAVDPKTKGGDQLIGENHDYFGLPKNVLKISEEGAANIKF